MYRVIRNILFALSEDDAEKAHDIARRWLGRAGRVPPLVRFMEWCYQANHNPRPATVCGIEFPNRIGLAAGFDKHAEMLPMLQALGFGFVEVGTVTPHPQTGQVRPRVFRSPEDNGLINRMGFNSQGVDDVRMRLARVYKKIRIPLGLSPGKMKETPIEQAAEDYDFVIRWAEHYAKYLVANISSPNTPGLRDLQGRDHLLKFVSFLVAQEKKRSRNTSSNTPKPIFVKLAPDLTEAELEESIDACEQGGAHGLVIGNTTLTRPVRDPQSPFAKEAGGYSGPRTYHTTKEKLIFARKRTKLPIIAVGGINNAPRAKALVDLGADLIEVYTGFIYGGPGLISDIRRAV